MYLGYRDSPIARHAAASSRSHRKLAACAIALAAALLLFSSVAAGFSERIDFAPGDAVAGQEVHAVLSGELSCTYVGLPKLTQTGNRVELVSKVTYGREPCTAVVLPYAVAAPLGQLPSGTYAVAWAVEPAGPGIAQPQPRELTVRDPPGVPTLTTVAIGCAALLLVVSAALVLGPEILG